MLDNFVPDEEFLKISREASEKAFGGVVDPQELEKFLNGMQGDTETLSIPSGEEAIAELYTVGIYGYVKCTPTKLDHLFEANHWGLGLNACKAYGVMHTAYENWGGLFRETRGYHAQGITKGGGILQITWFDGKARPVGQFNAVAGGIGAFEVGGKGRWKKK